MNREDCLLALQQSIKKRDLFKVRDLLMQNLNDYPSDLEFLRKCLDIAAADPLIFHKHDQEYLNSNDQKWNWSDYSYLKERLRKNFSQERYATAIVMAGYFEILRIEEAEAAAKLEAEQLEAELKKSRAEKKKQKRLLKKQQREARKLKRINDQKLPHKQMLMGVKISGLLLIYFIVHLIMTEF